MKARAYRIIGIFLGLFMITIGTNKFLGFIEIPHPPGDGGELMDIYISSGFLRMVGTLQILGGSALLFNRFLGIELTLITAIMFNASVFHILHDPTGIGGAAVCLLLSVVLIYAHKERFSSVFSP